ncbi:MAG: terminase family protein [Pseudomonadota bacterium]
MKAGDMRGGDGDDEIKQRLLALPPVWRARFAARLDDDDGQGLNDGWGLWSHGGQKEPTPLPDGSPWQTWVIMAGRGFGKTRAGAEWISRQARGDGDLRIALVAATLDEARRIMIEGKSGLLSVAADHIAEWAPSRRLLRFSSGAQAELFSGASPEGLRGPEHHIAWCDELAKWEKPKDSWDMLQLGLRLGDRPRVLVTTTPRAGPVLTNIMARPDCVTTRGPTYANPHVSDAYVATIRSMYEGTRLGRQEIEGELLGAAGALWSVELIERCRLIPLPFEGEGGIREAAEGRGDAAFSTSTVTPDLIRGPASSSESAPHPVTEQRQRDPGSEAGVTESLAAPPAFTRTLIAVDPPSGDGTCGIIACARDTRGHLHVLADHSVTGRSPEGWARAVGSAAAAHGTREVIAESNQGGRMVKSILLAADPNLHVRLVTAVHGKSDRADPVAHLFQRGKAWLAGRFPELEAQLLGLIAGGGYDGPGKSPDRADAMVWGLSTLSKDRGEVRVRVV